MGVYENLKRDGYVIPQAVEAKGLYKPVNQTGNLLYTSGQGSIENGVNLTGRVGIDVTLEEAQHAAEVCMLNTLAAVESYLGDLNKVKKVVKVLAFVAGADDFTQQAQVVNAASEVLISAFGEEGRHARSAIGTNNLPLGLTVEIETIFEVE
ncbi:MAG: RidA family protein [Firmicutes bacterium]|nr:RidA family protein [Bacillota bacterium]